ncbi:alpha/beta hydrolase [Ktedonobacter sp. SOSP1-52]|uniref:alpha/beta hydrolase n=1 Tax=Ktedonobacter sp. SOSP1-52 TaxID=2778366 RepID=UPI0019168A6A|nr:alpha/beta hydrolase [Ktedonobacter sp. SOSP1-52]GHO62607.1 alpha/beta hydrolase [Ktedonobacter sp. SOSP1-52]
MTTSLLLDGISQRTLQTSRLTMAYLTTGQGATPVVLVHGNCSSSLFFQDFMLALAATGSYTVYAPDMRGYGESETLPVDATRGVRDYSDDLAAFVQALNLPPFHLLGWSLGGNIIMQYAIDYPGTARTLLLEASGSPYGFGGSKDAAGTPTWLDSAGSGGGTVNADFVKSLQSGDRGSGPTSSRTTMNAFYFKPPFQVSSEREEIYVSAILSTKVTPGNYPGDMLPSENWPGIAPGKQGVNNALAPKYLNQSALVDIADKPPILWFHGADDQIVSDTSMFDIGFLGQLGVIPGWPGAQIYPPQPMKTQIRTLLESYQANGGNYQEHVLPECGHSPHIEKQDEVLKLCTEFMDAL